MLLIYKEKLPNECCPPPESKDVGLTDVWRFLRSSQPTEACFASHAAKNIENKKAVCPCKWASCSLYQGERNTKEMLKLQMFKNFVARAKVEIPAGSGHSKQDGTHVDFWEFDHFSFISAVVQVELK